MKKKMYLAAAALLIGAIITAQSTTQTQAQGQTTTTTRASKQEQERSRAEAKAQEQKSDKSQGLPAKQVAVPDQYNTRGQMVSEQRHARNAERKALKRQQREQRRLEAKQKMEQQNKEQGMEQAREQAKSAPANKGARNPNQSQQRGAGKASKGSGGQGRR